MGHTHKNRSRHMWAAMSALALGAANAAAVPNADFYLLTEDGMLHSGVFTDGIATPVAATPLGKNTSAMEYTPDGKLLGIGGGPGVADEFVGEIDPDTGVTTTLVSIGTIHAIVPDIWVAEGIAVAPDGSFYIIVVRFAIPSPDLNPPDLLLHFNRSGSFLGLVEIDSEDAYGTLDWLSNTLAIREDGMLASAEWSSTSTGHIGRIVLIDPTTGEMSALGSYAGVANKARGMSTLGSYAYLTLGEQGQDVYTIDLYTGDLTYVTTLSGYTGTAYGFALAPPKCPCDLDRNARASSDDITMFVNAFLTDAEEADLDFDRDRDLNDIAVFVGSYLDGCD